MRRNSRNASKPVDKPSQKTLTNPSREVQILLKIAGPDRPDIRDLENSGTRRTRGDVVRERTNSRSVELDVKSQLSQTNSGPFDFVGPETSSPISSPVSEKMGKGKKRARSQSTHSEQAWKIRCICGAREEGSDASEAWIECNSCGNWQHNVCMGISTFTSEIPKRYDCQDCNPDAHKELLDGMDRKERPWETRRKVFVEKLAEEKKGKKRKRVETGEDQVMGDLSELDSSFPLTEECHHYIRKKDVGWDIQKLVSSSLYLTIRG